MSKEEVFLYAVAMQIVMKIVCFILGYLTVRLGYDLIKSGVKGEFKFSANMGGMKADLASVSPGLLFVVLGVFLIGYAMYVEKKVDVTSQAAGKPPVLAIPQTLPFENSKADSSAGNKPKPLTIPNTLPFSSAKKDTLKGGQ